MLKRGESLLRYAHMDIRLYRFAEDFAKKEQLLAAKHYTTLSENIEKKESLLTYQDKKGTEDNWRDESTD